MTVELLECTLRDGSYEIDFQFSAAFTKKFCQKLEELNFPYIEIGHGMGVGASHRIKEAAASDLQYARAASSATSKSLWGMFAIPGVAQIEDVKNLVDEGMKFIRVGIDALEMEQGIDFLSKIKGLNLEVYVNFMKSYALPIDDFVSRVKRVLEFEVDGIYLVDSAGGMLPTQINELGSELSKFQGITKLGFHGHDNLGLAIANSIDLVEKKFNLIDCTMQGIGRSSGNASTEKLISILSRMGLGIDYDVIEVLKAGEDFIRPLIPYAGHSGLDTMAGYALFHTSYMDNLLKVCEENDADPYILMQEHCKTNLMSGSTDEFKSLVGTLEKLEKKGHFTRSVKRYVGNEQ